MKQINIPDEIYERLEKRAEETEFKTADEYVQYILEQVILRIDGEKEKQGEDYNKEDEKLVKERLRSLGYLD